MKSLDMKVNQPYKVTKSNSDTLMVGDIIWVSENGHLNIQSAAGWLMEDEWKSSNTVDFEVEEANDFYILKEQWFEGLRKKINVNREIV